MQIGSRRGTSRGNGEASKPATAGGCSSSSRYAEQARTTASPCWPSICLARATPIR